MNRGEIISPASDVVHVLLADRAARMMREKPKVGRSDAIRCRHHLAEVVALDFACRVAGWAGHAIALMCNTPSPQLNRGRRSVDRAVSCRLIAIQDQISLHSLSRRFYQ